jgi:hypothetical protein
MLAYYVIHTQFAIAALWPPNTEIERLVDVGQDGAHLIGVVGA